MHRIIKSNLKTFCEENMISNAISESKQFEYFVNYCIVKDAYGDDFDAWDITSEEDDSGIDGIAFLIDKELVITLDEAKNKFQRHKKSIDVDVYFIQAKTAEKYDRGDILKFGDGIEDFISESPKLPQGDFIKSQRKIFELLIEKIDRITNGRPNIIVDYACTSENEIAREIEATRQSIVNKLEKTRLFNEVEFNYLGVDELTALWKNTRNHISAQIPTSNTISFPEMKDINQSYLTIVSAKKYVEKVLMDESGKLRGYIFDENVRAFLGEDNPVNNAIASTIDNQDSQNRFAILNNGITIISPEVKNMGTHISISDYQIVNGCQTSNVLFNNYDKLDESTYITVRIVQVEKSDVVSEVVRATNSQTKVDDTQFLSFTTLFRRIEQYFESIDDASNDEIKLFLERRINQYKGTDIPKNRVYKIQEVCRAVESMFFDRPDAAGRNPSKLIKEDIENLSDPKNKEIAYYAATLALYRVNQLVHKGRILNDYTIYRWHVLMILKYILSNGSLPKIKNKKSCESFCKRVIKICTQADEKSTKVFEEAIHIINAIGRENRDVIRSSAYTQKIVDYCKNKYLK